MFSTDEYLKAISENYTSAIYFNREITGTEPLPRSSNISRIAWANDGREWGLFVEFHGTVLKNGTVKPNSGYLYKTNNYALWQELVMGAQTTDRTSTGIVFYEKVRGKVEFERIF